VGIDFQLDILFLQLEDEMQSITFEPRLISLDSSFESARILAAITAIPEVELSTALPDFSNHPLVDHEFVSRQHSAKRIVAHVAGRSALVLLLKSVGIPIEPLIASRDKNGKPILTPAQFAFSIAHDESLAIAVICTTSDENAQAEVGDHVNWRNPMNGKGYGSGEIGVDIELAERRIEDSVLDQIVSGEVLDKLKSFPSSRLERLDGWLLREAVCKAAGLQLSSHAKRVTVDSTPDEATLEGGVYSIHRMTEMVGDSAHRICIAGRDLIRG